MPSQASPFLPHCFWNIHCWLLLLPLVLLRGHLGPGPSDLLIVGSRMLGWGEACGHPMETDKAVEGRDSCLAPLLTWIRCCPLRSN